MGTITDGDVTAKQGAGHEPHIARPVVTGHKVTSHLLDIVVRIDVG